MKVFGFLGGYDVTVGGRRRSSALAAPCRAACAHEGQCRQCRYSFRKVPHAWIVLRVQGIGFALISTHLLALSAFLRCEESDQERRDRHASMHLLVPSAFRPGSGVDRLDPRLVSMHRYDADQRKDRGRSVSMHLLVLSAFRRRRARLAHLAYPVSMHLLVLNAFQLTRASLNLIKIADASQCTFWCSMLSDTGTWEGQVSKRTGLNAPSGAQCFPTHPRVERGDDNVGNVSMHLLVLNAFRPRRRFSLSRRSLACLNAPSGAQRFPT